MRRLLIALSAAALLAALLPATGLASHAGTIRINELRIDQSGSDDDEYFELVGAAAASLDGLSYIVIGDGTGGSGVVESVTDLVGQAIGAGGFFVAAEATFSLGTADLTTSLNFENSDNVTHLLVSGFSGASGDDLDTDDDGTLDVTPWTAVVDSVALVETVGSGDLVYSSTTIGPDGSFVPAHVYDCSTDGWTIGSFSSLTDDTPGAINVCDFVPPPATDRKIWEIQGSGSSSPLEGDSVTIEGVVVGDFQGNTFAGDQLDGFHLQEEQASGETDDDPATSDGIFVFAPGAPDVSLGDVVKVTGTVAEFDRLTEITAVTSVEITGTASITPTTLSLPFASSSELERVEGMLVDFDQDLYISEYFNYDRSGEIVLTSERQFQGTHLAEPGAVANAIAAANAMDRITLDDGRFHQSPDPAIHPNGAEFTLSNRFRGGDILQDVTGVMHEARRYAFSRIDYRIHPTQGASYVSMNPRPTAPDAVGGDLKVASFNVLNFFTHLDNGTDDICGPTRNLECRGADNAGELTRQLDKLVAGIISLDSDIVGIQEIENDIYDDDGNRAHDAVLTLVEALNAVEGPGTWAWVGEANYYNDYPVRNEIIYRTASVEPVGDPIAYADDAFDRKRPGDDEPVGRPPFAQTFTPVAKQGGGQQFAVVVNHFKSKGSSCSSIGDPDAGDGQGNCNLTRVAQSEALLDFVDDLKPGTVGVLVIGDLNSYAMEDPIATLKDGGLTELVEKFVPAEERYSFVFDGQLGYLDHALATRSMLNRVTGVTIFHINVDEPDLLDYDTSFKRPAQDALYEPNEFRSSDHDPVIVGLRFAGKKPGK